MVEEEGNCQGLTPEMGLAKCAVSRHGENKAEQVPGDSEEHKLHGHFQS